MALTKTLARTRLQLVIVKEDVGGKEKLGTINFPNIVESAKDEDIQAVGAALGDLQKKLVKQVLRIDANELSA